MYTYCTHLDFGVIGEMPVEVNYTWHKGSTTIDRYEAPDPSGAIIVNIVANILGAEVEVYGLLNDDLKADLEYECSEDYLGAVA